MGKSRNGPMFNSTNKNENKKQNLLMSSEFANSGKQQQQQQQSESGKHDVDKFNSDNESDYGKNSFAIIKFKLKKI
jgi:hypothetical protein